MNIIYFLIFCLCLADISKTQNKETYIAWITDTHIGNLTGEDDLKATVSDINNSDSISFTIISGDITEYGSAQQLNKAKEILDNLNKPYYIIPGNHDTKWSESGGTLFPILWDNDKFEITHNGIKFIGMHQGPLMKMGDGHFSQEDLRWLDEILGRTKKDQPIIFISHYPVDESITNWFEVTNRLINYKVICILCGHGHANKRLSFDGITGIMGRSNLRAKDKTGGYNIIRISNDSIYFYERNPFIKTHNYWQAIVKDVQINHSNIKKNKAETLKSDDFVNIKWKVGTGYTIASSPVVFSDKVYVGNASGNFYCLKLKDGSEIWKFKTYKPIYSTAAATANKIVFASTDSSIYCLNTDNGNLIWKYKASSPIVASPYIQKDYVFIGSSDNKFRALDLNTGNLIWENKEISGFVETTPLIEDDKIIFGAWDEYLYCLNKNTGKTLWKWKGTKPGTLLSPAACKPVSANDKVFIVAPDRFITAININNGETVWRTGDYQARETIGISEDSKKIYVRTMNDTILAISTLTNFPEVVWKKFIGFGYDINSAQIVEKDGFIFYPTKSGVLYSINSNNGEIVWKTKTGNALANTVYPLSNKEVILTNLDGEVMLINSEK